jgi:hypothetical protein
MDRHFEFTDLSADRASDAPTPAADERSASDADSQADAGQQVRAVSDTEALSAERDDEALAQRGDATSYDAVASEEISADGRPAMSDARSPARVRHTETTGDDDDSEPQEIVRPGDTPKAVGATAMRVPDHVQVFYLDAPESGSDMGQRDGADARGATGDLDRRRLEFHHEPTDRAAHRSTSGESGDRTGEQSGADQADDGAADNDRAGNDAAETGAEEGEGKRSFTKALNGVLRVTGRVISDASQQALEAYRQGPGERTIEAHLETQAERYGNREVRRQVRAAKRGAPRFQRQFAANNVRYHASKDIKSRAKREYKDAVRASWREEDEDARGAQEQDDQE